MEALGRGIDLVQNGEVSIKRCVLFFSSSFSFAIGYVVETHVSFCCEQDKNILSHLTKFLCPTLHKRMFLLKFHNLYKVLLTVTR